MHQIQLYQSKMTLLSHQISSLAVCKLILLLSLLPGSSALILRESGKPKVILLANRPFDFRCTVKGTLSELANAKITWEGPDSITITGNDANGNITVEYGTGNVTSILTVAKPPDYPPKNKPPAAKYYKCEWKSQQHSFLVYIVKEEAVPKIHPIQLIQTRHREKVLLKCDASYQNKNYRIKDKFDVILNLIKDGKILANKTVDYETGNHTVTLNHSVTINSREDVGIYVCQSQLAVIHETYTDSIIESKEFGLRTLPFLNGPEEKEIKATTGSNITVELHCDVIGYPITYRWRDEENCLIGVDKSCTDSRIKQKDNILYIDDIGYKDQKKYTCVGNVVGNEPMKQIIFLRVQGQSSQGTRAELTTPLTMLLICMYTFCILKWL